MFQAKVNTTALFVANSSFVFCNSCRTRRSDLAKIGLEVSVWRAGPWRGF